MLFGLKHMLKKLHNYFWIFLCIAYVGLVLPDPSFSKENTSELSNTQHVFAVQFSVLVLQADAIGYNVAFGDGYRDDRCAYGHIDSLHKLRLAHDLILKKNGIVLGEKDHSKLHDVWDGMGGAQRIEGDLNHYSWAWGTVR